MSNQRIHIDAAVRHHIHYRFKVPLRRPADVGKRVIMAVLFVSWVMPARSIGTGNLKRKFLFVEVVARKFKSRHANEYNPASFSAHKCRLVNGFVAPGGRGD